MKYFIPLLASLLLLQGCGNSSDSKSDTQASIFKLNMTGDVTSLDPAFADNQANTWAISQLFNTLVRLDDQMQIVPDLATSWDISESGKVFEFTLRKDVKFHAKQGQEAVPLRAKDVVYSLKRLLDPKLAADGSWVLAGLVDPQSGIEATDEHTVRITLSRTFQPFLSRLTMPYCSIISEEAAQNDPEKIRVNPVGTGPFMLTSWKEGEQLLIRRNAHYYHKDAAGNSLPYLDAVAFSFTSAKSTEFLQFENGELDFISDLDASLMGKVIDGQGNLAESYNEKYKLLRGIYFNTEYLGFNLEKIPTQFQSELVRQAINQGFDRKKMLATLRKGKGIPATAGMVPPGLLGAKNTGYGYDYNPEQASKLLAEAGYPGGKGLPEITLKCNEQYADLCGFVSRSLQDIGIEVKTQVVEGKILREWMVKGEADFFRASWIVDYPDPESYLTLFYGANGAPPNYTRFQTDEFDALYQQAVSETDPQARNDIYRAMDSLVMQKSSVIPLYYDEVLLLTQPDVSGLEVNPMNMLRLEKVAISN